MLETRGASTRPVFLLLFILFPCNIDLRSCPTVSFATRILATRYFFMPIRINKYLADKGYSTRRGADELIIAKKVLINGRVAVLGDKVEETDVVEVNVKTLRDVHANYKYYAYNKPIGIVTHSAQEEEEEILDVAGLTGVSPLGRLDKESHGLILLTNDGRVTKRLLEPQFDHQKEYLVKTTKPIKQSQLSWLARGVKLEDGYITKPAEVFSDGDYICRIVLTEGKKHQIRRMITAVGNEVKDLQRIRIMNIELGELKPGAHREIKGAELKKFLLSLGL